ncbi:Flavin-containing monooxygenase [Saliniradius amylolyticus]|uniref:Flavin-containing monooxygenase n=1 Tax=Saliniradius amylolyticus TaxID=2183582 RepID=A0A2S2E3G3_9ALTE|nr:NAD(P)-binding domain-containing protein [Saliniradius amylolyticus]AWL12181.1 Flavin-containing monooxygenase [Saliniradius amylolyticus]
MKPYVVIGAGPMGLCTVRRLAELDIPVVGLEAHRDVGGLWDIDSPTSTMYDSAHLISSKRMTEFADFPMKAEVAAYPRHDEMREYFRDYARHFDLYKHYRFGCWVEAIEPDGDDWQVVYQQGEESKTLAASGVLIANGTLHHPKRVEFPGQFDGERLHSCDYRDPALFEGKRVLIVGCGNSGCDIAVDAVHRAHSVDMVVRRGYYFLPKFVAGKPTDTLGGKLRLPNRVKQWVDGTLVRLISGKPSDFGLPDPDYKMYESHPVVNSLFLHHIGHGDIQPRPGIERLTATGAEFKDGSNGQYDLILEATGYKLHYPFIDADHLNWQGDAPALYLNAFTPKHDNLFVMGMVEAAGLGWQGRDDQAQVVARFIQMRHQQPELAGQFMTKVKQCSNTRIDGGLDYLPLERMAYYVHKQDYLKALSEAYQFLGVAS